MRFMKFLMVSLGLCGALAGEPVELFDGESLAGWEVREGEERWWQVRDGAITGGSLEKKVPHNTFLASTGSYENFELKFRIRLVKGEGFQNSGLQVRSVRKDDSHEMIGYQIDAGIGYWGDIYDESRRNRAIAKPIDPDALGAAVHDWDWNAYRILCEGPRIRTWINGVLAHDYTEEDPEIPRDGRFGLQAHGGGKFLVQMKDVTLRELPPTPGAPTWENPRPDGARTPTEERAGFRLPEGFEVELVASEEHGVSKPIAVSWDRRGRMWTMTAVEYPVDANENEAAARALFARGGADRVLVFDEPNRRGPQTPREFADGLAIPLGLLPTADGALVHYGPEIRRYRDADGDGRADDFETVLEGFGIQDSHLFPHQFTRAPGGWIYLAQGAFNRSEVRRPDGRAFADGRESVSFNHCKLARFKPDGSRFEKLTGGPNNIWGLVIARNGETFLQEANDMGYPVAEFAPGTHYPTPFGPKMRSDAPVLPRSTPRPVMGGTGLSGLALAEDADSPFAAGYGDARVFYVVNPITSRIQIVTLERDADGHPVYQKEDDFMLSDDPWFRPVAARFGPDGCLYIVDWYNKIISHNEVPRTHPDRDKTRGRIWRVRHASQPVPERVDVAAMSDETLLATLGGPNALVASQAWREIVDRRATGLSGKLAAIAGDAAEPLARRIAALWALEGLETIPDGLLALLANSPRHELRHEVARIAGEQSLPPAEFIALLEPMAADPHFRVRAAVANAARDHQEPTPEMLALVARLGRAPGSGSGRAAYDRDFERYLARWAMSDHPGATRAMLAAAELPAEARLLAVRSFEGPEAALGLLEWLPEIRRPLIADELALLGEQLDRPEVRHGLAGLLADAERAEPLLKAMMRLDSEVAAKPRLAEMVGAAAKALLAKRRDDARERLVVGLARKFRIAALAPEVVDWLAAAERNADEIAAGLATLREIGVGEPRMFRPYLVPSDDRVRREALVGLSRLDDPAVVAEIARLWDKLEGASRSLAVDGMTATEGKAAAFARALAAGEFAGFDATAVEKLVGVLGLEHPAAAAMLERHEGILRPILRLDGRPGGRVATGITLDGPFTLESWVRLERPGQNADSLGGNRARGFDLNFYHGRLRLHAGGEDRIVADRETPAGEWTHCALTRDAEGRLTLYLDGEPQAGTGRHTGALAELNLGESVASGGGLASYDEFRIWSVARGAEEIRRDYRTRFASGKPEHLRFRATGAEPGGTLEGGAVATLTRDFPDLVTPAEAAALEEKFARFRDLADAPGDLENGRKLAEANCLICHQVEGEGIAIGPDLSGAGAMGVESLLRNILTPSAQLESGYYRHDVRLADGRVVSGFLAGEDGDSIRIRQIGADVEVIPREEIAGHEISRRSIMPEGLIDGFGDDEVADLFEYLRSLK
jgi:putative heme-binding domain-containing protein